MSAFDRGPREYLLGEIEHFNNRTGHRAELVRLVGLWTVSVDDVVDDDRFEECELGMLLDHVLGGALERLLPDDAPTPEPEPDPTPEVVEYDGEVSTVAFEIGSPGMLLADVEPYGVWTRLVGGMAEFRGPEDALVAVAVEIFHVAPDRARRIVLEAK